MPGIWDHLSAEIIAAGPRRVELKPHAPSGAVLHELRVPHAPLLSTDEPPLDADDLTDAQLWQRAVIESGLCYDLQSGALAKEGYPSVSTDDVSRFVWSEKTNRYEWEKA